MQQALELAEVLVMAAAQVARALDGLAGAGDLEPALREIDRLESEGDRVLRDARASPFADGIDAMVVIR